MLESGLRTGHFPQYIANAQPLKSTHLRPLHQNYLSCTLGACTLQDLVHPQLALVFEDLQFLINTLNEHIETSTQLDGADFQVAAHSIYARLLHLQNILTDPASECVRLGLLAFLTTLAPRPSPVTVQSPRFPFLAEKMEDAIQSVSSWEGFPEAIPIWLGVVTSMSAFDGREEWLCQWWKGRMNEDTDWEGIGKKLKTVMWVPYLHEEAGRLSFSRLSRTKELVLVRNT